MDLEIKSHAADIVVAPLRRSPRWGLLLMVLAILMVPLSLIAVHSRQFYAEYLSNQALYEIQHNGLEMGQSWHKIADEAEKTIEAEKKRSQQKNMVLTFLLLPIFGFIYMLGRRLRVGDSHKVIGEDLRPAILYLRSFSADRLEYNYFTRTTNEERLVKLLGRVGPVIAIGKPSEWLPRVGAARLYVHEHRWQMVVDQLLDQSGLIVLVGGNSPGLLWEMQRLRDRVSPRRILLYNPPAVDWKHFEKLRISMYEIFHVTLPAKYGAARLIAFDEHWQPIANPHLSLKKQFAALLPELLALPPPSHGDELRQLLAKLNKDTDPMPSFRIHPLAIIPCAALGATILTRSINEDVNWVSIALRLFELSVALTIGVAASLWLWLYSQKRWLTTSVFCSVVSIVLVWNVTAIYQARAEEQRSHEEFVEAQQRLEVTQDILRAYDQWAHSHQSYLPGNEGSGSNEPALEDLIRTLDSVVETSTTMSRTRDFAERASQVVIDLARASVRYQESLSEFDAAGGADYTSFTKQIDVERRLRLLSDVRARLEDMWAQSHKNLPWNEGSGSDELDLEDLIRALDSLAGSSTGRLVTRNFTERAGQIVINIARANIGYQGPVDEFDALRGAGHSSFKTKLDIERKLKIISDVRSREDRRESEVEAVDGGDAIAGDFMGSVTLELLDTYRRLLKVADSLLRLLSTEWSRCRIDRYGKPEFETSDLNTRFETLNKERRKLELRLLALYMIFEKGES